jgi:TM2 domain-containing membrane protein YozV
MNRNIICFKTGLIVIFLSFSSISYSQSSAGCDLKFIFHLVNTGAYNEAIYLTDSTDCSLIKSNDSLNYLRGWSLYSLKRLNESSIYLLKISPSSEFYLKSQYFAAYNYAYTGDYNKSLLTLSGIPGKSEKEYSLKNFENAGIFLLQGDTTRYRESFSKINRNLYEISEYSDNLQKISEDLKRHKTKSPVIAGLLSGIIPGSGKFYAGKRGEAISAFIGTAGLGLVTWENYRKSGLRSFKTIAFGTAFAFTYVANIYGAVMTVNIIESEYKNNVKNSILFNLHIPLRNTFDK